MRRTQLFIWTSFLLLAAATGAGYLATARVQPLTTGSAGPAPQALHLVGVNRRAYETAGQLATMTDTDGEQHLANEALQLADQVLDQSLQSALSAAELDAKSTGSGGQALLARMQRSLQSIDRRKAQQARLEEQLRQAPPGQRQQIEEQLAMVQAQAGFDQAQLSDARADALRSSNTDLGLLQQVTQEHDENHSAKPQVRSLPPGTTLQVRGLADALLALWRSHQKQEALRSAGMDVHRGIQQILQQHAALEARIQQETHPEQKINAEIPAMLGSASLAAREQGRKMASQTIDLMHRLAGEQKRLSGFDQQIQLEQQLQDVYHRWQLVAARQRQQVLHVLFRELLLLFGLLGTLILLDRLTEGFFSRLPREQKRLSTLRRLTRLGFIVVGVTGTLMTAFGRPGQLATLLGLTGAGLTVAFQDALLSMAGWFVLMGRNGIAIGDWVEINGVTGEVIDVGLLRTVLLETGNWTEPGHPTGRKVFCPNSFAFRTPYFNFTTARQWLWDEIQVALPANLDPRKLALDLVGVAQHVTGADAEAAALDHQRLHRLHTLHSIATAPVVQLRPGAAGLLISIRYVTTAQRRSEIRERLYQAILASIEREQERAAQAGRS